MFDPHYINKSNKTQRKAQVIQARLVNQVPPIDPKLVKYYYDYMVANDLIPRPIITNYPLSTIQVFDQEFSLCTSVLDLGSFTEFTPSGYVGNTSFMHTFTYTATTFVLARFTRNGNECCSILMIQGTGSGGAAEKSYTYCNFSGSGGPRSFYYLQVSPKVTYGNIPLLLLGYGPYTTYQEYSRYTPSTNPYVWNWWEINPVLKGN